MRCTNCKAELLEKTEICPYCGKDLTKIQSSDKIIEIKEKTFEIHNPPYNLPEKNTGRYISLNSSHNNKSANLPALLRLIVSFAFIFITLMLLLSGLPKIISGFKDENISSSISQTTTIPNENQNTIQNENENAFKLVLPEDENMIMSPQVDIPMINLGSAKLNLELVTVFDNSSNDSVLLVMHKYPSEPFPITLNSSYINNIKVNDASWIVDKNGMLSTYIYRDNLKYEDIDTIDLLFDVNPIDSAAITKPYQIKIRVYQNGYFGVFASSVIS